MKKAYGDEQAKADERRRKTFGAFLKAQREARQWTQEDMADKVNISQAYVGQWEVGEPKRYHPDDMRAWARAFEMPVARILIEAGFLTHADLAAADPSSYVSPLVILLGERLPPLVTEDDVELVAELAWAARRWAERHGAPEARTAGQTTQVETPPTVAPRLPRARHGA